MMSEKCLNINKRNNNSDNPLTSRRTDGGKKLYLGQNALDQLRELYHSAKKAVPSWMSTESLFASHMCTDS